MQFGTIVGFVENLKRHYCMDCQSWYCFRHTRIASHTGVCGFDSQCCCYTCFARLPAEQQQYLEGINKLQPVSGSDAETSSSRGKSSPGLSRRPSLFPAFESAEGRERGAPQGVDTGGELIGLTGTGAGTGMNGAASTVRRAASEYQLLEHAEEGEDEEEGGREEGGEVGDLRGGSKKKGIRKCVSNPVVDRAVPGAQTERKSDGEGRWLKSVLSTLSLSNKSGESSSVGSSAKSVSTPEQDPPAPLSQTVQNGEAAPGQKSKGLGLGLGLGLCQSSSTDRAVKKDQSSTPDESAGGEAPVSSARVDRAIALQSSFDKISEIEEEAEDSEPGSTRGALGPSAIARNASAGGRSEGCEGEDGSPGDMSRQPSLGKSRSFREESGRLEAPIEEGAPSEETGDLLAHQRSSSYEHLVGQSSRSGGSSTDGPVVQSQSGEEQRKQEGSTKRGLRKGIGHTLTHLVPGSPHHSETSTGLFNKVRDLLPRGLHDGARPAPKS